MQMKTFIKLCFIQMKMFKYGYFIMTVDSQTFNSIPQNPFKICSMLELYSYEIIWLLVFDINIIN